MKRFIFAVLFFCVTFCQLYPAGGFSEKDSLINTIMSFPPDSTRLNKIREIARLKQTTDDFFFYTDLLLHEASLQNDVQKIYTAYYFRLVGKFNRNEFDSIPLLVNKIKEIAYQEQDFYYYFNATRFLIESYYLREHFEMAIDEGLKIKEEALSLNNNDGVIAANIAVTAAYQSLDRMNEAITLLEESLLLPNSNENETKLNILLRLMAAYSQQKDYPKLFNSLNQLSVLLEQIIALVPERIRIFDDYYFYLYTMYSYYYLQTDNLEAATVSWERAGEYYSPERYYLYQYYYHQLTSNYYAARKDNQAALSANKLAMNVIEGIHPEGYIQLLYERARLLALSDSSELAAALYDYVFAAVDSIRQDFSEKQVNRILGNYNLEKELYEQKQYEKKTKIVFLTAILLLIAIIGYYIYKYVSLENKLKESARIIREARCKIEQANEDKNLFMRNICHDIRSYLTSIVGFSELVSAKDQTNEAKSEYQQIIEDNSMQLTALINNILELSRHEVGKIPFEEEHFNLMDLLSETVAQIPVKSDFSESLSPCGDMVIGGDRTHFQEVITSLFDCHDRSFSETQFIRLRDSLCNNPDNRQIELCVYGSTLEDTTDELHLFTRNEINRCSIQKQRGTYQHLVDEEGKPYISISMPYGPV
ncbi:MAG: histidine kinase dimerization/phospho-acceptor domain-containing protein [Bacteroidales bacterium]